MRLVQTISDYIRRSILTATGDMVIRSAAGQPERFASGAIDTFLQGKGAGVLPAYEAMPVEGWTAPTLLNSWVNVGGVYATAGYYKDLFGVVHLKGDVKDGTGIPTNIFRLPANYRPTETQRFAIVSAGIFGSVRIFADGNVEASSGNTAWLHIDGITFRTD